MKKHADLVFVIVFKDTKGLEHQIGIPYTEKFLVFELKKKQFEFTSFNEAETKLTKYIHTLKNVDFPMYVTMLAAKTSGSLKIQLRQSEN